MLLTSGKVLVIGLGFFSGNTVLTHLVKAICIWQQLEYNDPEVSQNRNTQEVRELFPPLYRLPPPPICFYRVRKK